METRPRLLCLKQACLELSQGPLQGTLQGSLVNRNAKLGLKDSLQILIENIKELQKIPSLPIVAH